LKKGQLFYSLILLAGVVVFGTVGFYLTEEQVVTLFDAFYFTLVTMTTVGYGDIVPTGMASRIVASVLMVAGIGAMLSAFQSVFNMVVTKSVREVLGFPEKRTKMKDHIIVIGYGKLGKHVAAHLQSIGEPFLLVENDHEKVEKALDDGLTVIEGDALEDETLVRANIEKAKGVITTLADPLNVLVIISAKMLNPQIRVVAKVENKDSILKLRKAGADEIVDCSEIGARVMVSKVKEVIPDSAGNDPSTVPNDRI